MATALLLLSGCGGGDDEEAVRSAVERWRAAGEADDHATYCDLLSEGLRGSYDRAGEQFADPGEDPCEAAAGLQADLEVDDAGAEILIDPIEVEGSQATAGISISLPAESSQPITTTIGLSRDDAGDWKISDMGVPPPGT